MPTSPSSPSAGCRPCASPTSPAPARQLYQTICELVVAHTDAYPGLRAMLDGTARPGTPPELLSFSDWAVIAGPTRDAVAASPLVTNLELKDEMRYVWPAVRDHLTQCGVLIGPSGIEIRPYHPPTALNPPVQPRQAADLPVGHPRLDGRPPAPSRGRVGHPPDHRNLAAAWRDRRAAAGAQPQCRAPLRPARPRLGLNQAQAAGGRAAWLCASHAEADTLQETLTAYGQQVYRLRPGDDSMVDTGAASRTDT